MKRDHIAKASVAVNAPVSKVWGALIDPASIKVYMFGATVISDWKEGSPIVWKGEWKGNPYEDKGVILQLKPNRLLEYTHFSPMMGLPDRPENYHKVRIELSSKGKQTTVALSQDNNATEEAREHSRKNWEAMLASLKKFLEGN